MKEINELLEISDILMGPNGCPWDRKQTYQSLTPYFLEEANEVIDAIDQGDMDDLPDELGDLLYVIIFCAKIGEKEGDFTFADCISRVKEKLIRRHPHVFSDVKIETFDELKEQWEKIKSSEKSHSKRKSLLDGIPKSLPLIQKAQKLITKMKEDPNFSYTSLIEKTGSNAWEKQLLSHILEASNQEIDAESAFRNLLKNLERAFRDQEA